MKLEQHRTVFFVFVAGLAWADLIGIIVNTVPVLIVYTRGHFVGGVSWFSLALISTQARLNLNQTKSIALRGEGRRIL